MLPDGPKHAVALQKWEHEGHWHRSQLSSTGAGQGVPGPAAHPLPRGWTCWEQGWQLTHTEGARLSPLGGAWAEGEQNSLCRRFCWGSEVWHSPGTESCEQGPLPASPEHVSLSTSNLCPKSLFRLKVTLQLSICTDALKEKRGSASQSIFQIGDKNWLVMAENSTKDYYCW